MTLDAEDSDAIIALTYEKVLARFEAAISELARDLKNEEWIVRIVAEPIETPRLTVLPLKNELARFNDSVKVLTYANFSARDDATPREILRLLGKDLATEAVSLIEPDRDLKRADFS